MQIPATICVGAAKRAPPLGRYKCKQVGDLPVGEREIAKVVRVNLNRVNRIGKSLKKRKTQAGED